jgi:putative restriction endonuclease
MAGILKLFENLKTYRRGDRRAPHKPLLVLIALSKLQQGRFQVDFSEIEKELLPLLKIYAPPVAGKPQPELPYWYLQSDRIWKIENSENLPRQTGGFPRIPSLRQTKAGFTKEVIDLLIKSPDLIEEIIQLILDEHFAPSIHEDLLAQVGIRQYSENKIYERQAAYQSEFKKRNPNFREIVLRAYEHRCAVTGFRAALGGIYFGCEAAHVQWHAYDGPDDLANGICLEPTIHKLFDAGAWSLTDDRRIIVSKDYTGSGSAILRLRDYHGKTLHQPIQGEPWVAVEYIRWHRDPNLGGVFRLPAIDL